MIEVIGINGGIINLDHLPKEEKKESLSYEIECLLDAFGPMKKQLLIQYFTEKHAMIVVECLRSMARIKKVHEHGDYYTTDERLFDPESYSVPKVNGVENTFEKMKSYNRFLDRLEARQKAFAVYLHFREVFGAGHWILGQNPSKPWLVLSFIAREMLFHVVYIEDFNLLFANDMAADPREVRDRLALCGTDGDKKAIEANQVKGIKAYVKVDTNYKVAVKKPDGAPAPKKEAKQEPGE